VIGAGPNGLAAAIVLARAGLHVDVFEAEPTAGGAARTMASTLDGFLHDFGSAVFPLGRGSPFFSTLPLHEHGLEWIESPAALAHPFADGDAVVLERDLGSVDASLGEDARAWRALVAPFAERWETFARDVLRPVPSIPHDPVTLARFGAIAVNSARGIATRFRSERTRALFAGFAAHSFLSLDAPLGAAVGTIMAVSAHAVGWPIPRGGAQSLTNALSRVLATMPSALYLDTRVDTAAAFAPHELVVCDVGPRAMLDIFGSQLSAAERDAFTRFRYGPGVFKVDYALDAPIPWTAEGCSRAATVHLGGTFDEIAASEDAVTRGRIPERPFVLLAQPSLFDDSRAPAGKHTAWAYCHVPSGSSVDMLKRMEDQIERFAPGFRERVLARRTYAPAELQAMDANLVGGDIGGGALDLMQFVFRPSRRIYATSRRNIFICSSSTPPGAGVHGMCGYHAGNAALRSLGR